MPYKNGSNVWAKKMRDALFVILGKKCRWCGKFKNPEFDLIKPEKADIALRHHRKMSWSMRMKFYKEQMLKGNLQVLCSSCNTKKRNEQPLLYFELPIK